MSPKDAFQTSNLKGRFEFDGADLLEQGERFERFGLVQATEVTILLSANLRESARIGIKLAKISG
jgi:hypothetical protein